MTEIDTLRESLGNATAHVVPRPDVADNALRGAVRVRRRRRAGAIGGVALAAVVVTGLVAVVPRMTASVAPAAPTASAPPTTAPVPPCPAGQPMGCGPGWPSRGPRAADRALLDRGSAQMRPREVFGKPRTLWAGDLPDGRTLLLFEVPDRRSGAFHQQFYVERDGRPDVYVNTMSFSSDPVWFTTYVGGSTAYAVVLAPPGTTEIEFSPGSGHPMRPVTVTDGLAATPVGSEAAVKNAAWRYRTGTAEWQLTNLAYLPPKESP